MTDQPNQTDPMKGTPVSTGVHGKETKNAPREIVLLIDGEKVTKKIPSKATAGDWQPFNVWVTD